MTLIIHSLAIRENKYDFVTHTSELRQNLKGRSYATCKKDKFMVFINIQKTVL